MKRATSMASASLQSPWSSGHFERLAATWKRIDPATKSAILITILFSAIRIWLSTAIGLGVDESYASSMARDLSLSYVDDPPLHFWIAHAAQTLTANPRLVRLPFIAIGAVSSWMMYVLTSRMFGRGAGLWAVFAFNVTAFFTLVSSEWILPDGPLYLCFLMAANELSKLIAVPSPLRAEVWKRSILTGLWIGAAALTKYHAALFGLGILGFLATSERHRHLLRARAVQMAGLIVLAMCIPIVYWNAQHGWASLALQQHRAFASDGWRWDHVLSQLLGQTGLLMPWIVVPLIWAVVKAVRSAAMSSQVTLLLWLGLPIIIFFSVVPLWGIRGFPHWTMPGWLMLYPLLGRLLAQMRPRWAQLWAVVSLSLFLVLGGFAVFDVETGWIGATFPRTFSRGDPTVETMDWSQLRGILLRGNHAPGDQTEVVTSTWFDAGKIDQALQGALSVRVFGRDPHGYAFRPEAGGRVGARALIVVRQPGAARELQELKPYFSPMSNAEPKVLGRAGHSEIVLEVVEARQARLYAVAPP